MRMVWPGVIAVMFWIMSGAVGLGQLYPGLARFLIDYASHYTYTEVHIVVSGQDDRELLAASRLLLLGSRGWTMNVMNVGDQPQVLRRSLASSDSSSAHLANIRSGDGAAEAWEPTVGGFLKPVFITSAETALGLRRSLNWSVGEESRSVPWLVVGESIDPLLEGQQIFYPLDNMVTLALWGRKSGGQRVELWEVYQAGRNLPYRTSRIGLWLSTEEEEETTSFPSLSIVPRRTDMTGLHIRCLTENWHPFTDNQPDEKGGVTIGGFMGESFHLLSVFFNFTYDCRRAADRQFGDYDGERWTGLVGELVSGRGDVIVTGMDSTYQRSQVVDFCFPSGEIEYILVIRSPEADPWFNFTRQLQPSTWLACLAFYLLTPLLYHFLTARSPTLVSLSLRDSWFAVQTLILNQGSLSVDDLPRRTFFLTVVMASWLIITFYTSVLVSYLTVPQSTLPFEDMAGLLKKGGAYSLGLQKGNSEVERLRTSRDPVLQEVWSKIVSRDPANLVATAEEGFRRVLEEDFAFLTEKNNYNYIRKGDCATTPLREVFTFGAGMVVQKDSPLRMAFSYYTLVHHVTGIMDRSRKRHQPSLPMCNSQKVEALGLTPLVTVFIIPAVAALLACFLLLLERRFHGCFGRRGASPPPKGAQGEPPPEGEGAGTQNLARSLG